jgi:transcriptional regulator with XRE-family HTH domain
LQYFIAIFFSLLYHYTEEGHKMEPLTLGERIQLMRRRRALTQHQLARCMGVAQSEIVRLETGLVKDPHFSRIIALATALEVTTDWLGGLRDLTDEANTTREAPPKRPRPRTTQPVG